MRIGLLTTGFPRREGDVAGHFVLGFARSLADRGHRIDVLAPEPLEPIQPPRWPGITVSFVRYVRPRSFSRTFYGAGVPDNVRDPRAWPGLVTFPIALARAARERLADCDALVSHFGVPSGLVGGLVRGDRPHLAVLHSADVHLLGRLPVRARFARALASGADHIVCVSEHARSSLLSWLGAAQTQAAHRIHVRPMGIELAAHRPNRDEARRALGLQRFTLLTLARLVPIKGLFPALNALRARSDLEWLIAGDGPERARLEALAHDSQIRVRFLGEIHGEQKRRCLAAADAMLLPSLTLPSGRSEGAPTAVLEAMAAGLPVIASAVGGIAETVEHARTGLLFDTNRPASLHAVIDVLMREPALGAQLARCAEPHANACSWAAIAPWFEQLLEITS